MGVEREVTAKKKNAIMKKSTIKYIIKEVFTFFTALAAMAAMSFFFLELHDLLLP